MKHLKSLIASTCVSAMMLTSCGTLGNLGSLAAPGAEGSQGLLESVLTGLLGNVIPMNEASLAGTWTYASPEVRFESESALAQAGGAVAANTIETKLAETYAKLGIKPGACKFTFNEDKTCMISLSGQSISGTYTVNPNTHDINIVSNTGLIKLSGKAYLSVNSLALLFDAKKLLSIMQTVGAITGQGSTIGSLSSVLNNYDGALVGMNLKK